MITQLQENQQYEGKILLSGGEALMASNNRIKGMFEQVGFTNVTVTGSGKNRIATGTWSKPSQEAEVPKQVVEIKKI